MKEINLKYSKLWKKRPLRKDFQYEYPNIGFNRTAHHEALEKWAEKAEAKIKELQQYKDTTACLLRLHRPDLVKDKNGLLFKLKLA